jgi:dienelactone hydrolase
VRARAAALCLLALVGCATGPRLAPVPEDGAGAVSYPSAGSLRRSGNGRLLVQDAPVHLSGELRFPDGGGPFPAIVLAHGCNGNRNVERVWGPVLREWGYATFVIDSFRGRGITEVCTQGGVLLPLERVPDAYGALRLLAANRRIDARRIALMGFSHGGSLTLLGATAWAKETYAAEGQASFRAFFSFYPNCNASFPERRRVSAPVRIHAGAADDWTPAGPCSELAASLKASGQDVGIDVYPAAHHGFDQAPAREIHLANANNGSACFPQAPSILGPVTASTVSGCLKKGATVAGNAEATAAARRNLRVQLDALMQ